jgi:hypothetical protein
MGLRYTVPIPYAPYRYQPNVHTAARSKLILILLVIQVAELGGPQDQPR